MLAASTNSVAREIVALAEAREKLAAEGARPGAKSAAFASVSKRFVDDINALIGALNQTTAHFVRCMKPNPRFAKLDFDHEMIMAQAPSPSSRPHLALILPSSRHDLTVTSPHLASPPPRQLKCNGTLEAVQLMRHGYPNRVPYDLMFDRYQKHLSGVPGIEKLTSAQAQPPLCSPLTSPHLASPRPISPLLAPSQFSEILAAIADLAPEDYALGVTKMFLKAGKGKFLEDLKDKPVDEVRPGPVPLLHRLPLAASPSPCCTSTSDAAASERRRCF